MRSYDGAAQEFISGYGASLPVGKRRALIEFYLLELVKETDISWLEYQRLRRYVDYVLERDV